MDMQQSSSSTTWPLQDWILETNFPLLKAYLFLKKTQPPQKTNKQNKNLKKNVKYY